MSVGQDIRYEDLPYATRCSRCQSTYRFLTYPLALDYARNRCTFCGNRYVSIQGPPNDMWWDGFALGASLAVAGASLAVVLYLAHNSSF